MGDDDASSQSGTDTDDEESADTSEPEVEANPPTSGHSADDGEPVESQHCIEALEALSAATGGEQQCQAGETAQEEQLIGTADDLEPTDLRRSERSRVIPSYLNDYVVLAALAHLNEPTTVQQALIADDSMEWDAAMQEEMQSLYEHNVWELTELPRGRKAIKNKWVFKKKLTPAGEVDRYKARLVVKGCSQTEGLDFKETYAPVMKLATIRMMLAIAAQTGQEIHQLDVKTAFLEWGIRRGDLHGATRGLSGQRHGASSLQAEEVSLRPKTSISSLESKARVSPL